MKSKNNKTIKDTKIDVRCTSDEKSKITGLAMVRGLTISEYVLSMALGNVTEPVATKGKPKKVKKTHIPVVPVDDDDDSERPIITKENVTIGVDIKELTHPLQKLIKENFPRVWAMKNKITEKQCIEIAKLDQVQVFDVIRAMENYQKLYNNVSIYHTILNWMQRRERDSKYAAIGDIKKRVNFL